MLKKHFLPELALTLLIPILFIFSTSHARARRSPGIQAMGILRKVMEMYANDHPQGIYSDNIMDFQNYTNITNLLREVVGEKITIELNQDKTHYTAIALTRDKYCTAYVATADVIDELENPKVSSDEMKKCLFSGRIQKIKDVLVFPAFLFGFPFFCSYLFYMRYKRYKMQGFKNIDFMGCIISFLIIFILCVFAFLVIIPNFMRAR